MSFKAGRMNTPARRQAIQLAKGRVAKPRNLVGKRDLVLHQVAAVVDPTDPKTRELVNVLMATCQVRRGLGLAAPQIGISRRVVVTADGAVLLNPTLEPDDDEMDDSPESCLSLPGSTYIVSRATACAVSFQDFEGSWQTHDTVGFESRVLQHEVDHLDGVLISDIGRQVRGPQLAPSF